MVGIAIRSGLLRGFIDRSRRGNAACVGKVR
jgi:hypothetical protein